MMMAEVGGIVKVSGSRIATPLAPPRPGSTPMITPSRMPTSIKARLYQDNATLKPPISEVISSTGFPPICDGSDPSPGLLANSSRLVGGTHYMAYGMPMGSAWQCKCRGIDFLINSRNAGSGWHEVELIFAISND